MKTVFPAGVHARYARSIQRLPSRCLRQLVENRLLSVEVEFSMTATFVTS